MNFLTTLVSPIKREAIIPITTFNGLHDIEVESFLSMYGKAIVRDRGEESKVSRISAYLSAEVHASSRAKFRIG